MQSVTASATAVDLAAYRSRRDAAPAVEIKKRRLYERLRVEAAAWIAEGCPPVI
jgi:hypothetical protein